jgi:hypothetical protein
MMLYRHTSGSAWDAFLPISAALDRQIMTALERAEPHGLICQEIEDKIGRIHQAVSGNLRHLVERGYVIATSTHGVTRSNRVAIKWRIAPPELWNKPQEPPKVWDEVEDLWAIIDDCRDCEDAARMVSDDATANQFARIADQLDDIAERLVTRMPA